MEWQKAAAARAAARKGMGFLKMTERKPVRLVAFDLDGTTLHGHAQLSARNRQAMERASAAGVLLVPATGRVKNFIPPCLTELPFIRYAITSNGGAVWDLRAVSYTHLDVYKRQASVISPRMKRWWSRAVCAFVTLPTIALK